MPNEIAVEKVVNDEFEPNTYEPGSPEFNENATTVNDDVERTALEVASKQDELKDSRSSVAKFIDKAKKEPVSDKDVSIQAEKATKQTTTDEKPAYVLNKKFKVLDKEQEFDDFVAAGIKDADTEKKVRDLYEKAYGLDHVKTERAQERTARESIENNYKALVAEVQQVSALSRNKDYGRLFSELQMNKADVAKWLVEQHDLEEKVGTLPEPVRKIYNEYGTLKEQNESLLQKVQQLESGSVDTAVQARASELKTALQAPEVAQFVTQFDTRLGKAGAFEDMVMRHGYSEWQLHKKDLSVSEAVDQVLKYLGHQAQAPSQGTTPNEPATPKPVVITAAPKPTIIPNVGQGTPASSAMKRPKNMADLRAMAKAAQDNA